MNVCQSTKDRRFLKTILLSFYLQCTRLWEGVWSLFGWTKIIPIYWISASRWLETHFKRKQEAARGFKIEKKRSRDLRSYYRSLLEAASGFVTFITKFIWKFYFQIFANVKNLTRPTVISSLDTAINNSGMAVLPAKRPRLNNNSEIEITQNGSSGEKVGKLFCGNFSFSKSCDPVRESPPTSKMQNFADDVRLFILIFLNLKLN